VSSLKKYKYKNECIYRYSRRKDESNNTNKGKKKLNHAKHEAISWDITEDINNNEEHTNEAEWVIIEYDSSLIEAIEESLEETGNIPSLVTEKVNILYDSVKRQVKVNKIEIRELKNILEMNPKYFCVSCTTDLCKDCFSSACITHNVLWVGNRFFRCSSPYHVAKE